MHRRSLGPAIFGLVIAACSAPTPPPADDGGTVDGARVDAAQSDAGAGSDAGSCDADHDGAQAVACGGTDCDDHDPNRFPGNPEVCDVAGHDEDCDALTFGDRDSDLDGHFDASCCNTDAAGAMHCGDDCDDTHASVYAGLVETCDGLDNDCDTSIDEAVQLSFYPDGDGDGYGSASASPTMACMPPAGFVLSNTDCDDVHAGINPGNPELCDGLDDDCSSGGGANPSEDQDADMHSSPTAACTGGFPRDDCNDTNAAIYAGAPELCDVIDDDCSTGGGIDPREDFDGDGHAPTGFPCSGGPLPHDDCDDTRADVHPGAAETCDRFDSNCSSGGGVDASEDADGDGHAPIGAACSGGFPADDCDDSDATVYPGSPLVAPRPLSPHNGAMTGVARHATFRWSAVPGCGVTYELQIDDSCGGGFASCGFASPELASTGITTASSVSPDLPVSTVPPVGTRYYWRVRACAAGTCTAYGAVRYVDVGRATSDFDGDGYSDLLVGAPMESGVATQEGRAHVFRGGAGGLASAPTTTLSDPGDDPNAWFGFSVAAAGDVNADGFGDAIVGAPYQDVGGQVDTGEAFVYLGSASGLPASPSHTMSFFAPGSFAGRSVASAGDIDADGLADVLIGAPSAPVTGTTVGTVYVHLAGGGIHAAPDYMLVSPSSGDNDFGISTASAGDLDSDGRADIVVGAPQFSGLNTWEGAAYVWMASATGLTHAPTITLIDPGEQTQARFGSSVASAGDVDGDGFSELLVAATSQSLGTVSDGGVVLVYGGRASGGLGAPTTLDDGRDGSSFGRGLAGGGDVNGDGLSDVIVGATGSSPGFAYVFLGGASGLARSTTLSAGTPLSNFGSAVAGAGDLDGDGLDDVAVGAPADDGAATDEGSVFVYRGDATSLSTSAAWSIMDPGDHASASFGLSVGSAPR